MAVNLQREQKADVRHEARIREAERLSHIHGGAVNVKWNGLTTVLYREDGLRDDEAAGHLFSGWLEEADDETFFHLDDREPETLDVQLARECVRVAEHYLDVARKFVPEVAPEWESGDTYGVAISLRGKPTGYHALGKLDFAKAWIADFNGEADRTNSDLRGELIAFDVRPRLEGGAA